MSTQISETALKVNDEVCSACSVCTYLCPFEAMKKDETGKTVLNIEKCQVCGLCYSACPARAIDMLYYDTESLVNYLEQAKEKYKSNTLAIMCRGSAPDFAGVEKLFGIKNFVPLSVPCVGRIPDEVFMKAIALGISKIYVLACDEDYCRFEQGSPVAGRRTSALNSLLVQLGYGDDFITFKRNSLKVQVDSNKCIACANCVFYCPYGAAKLESPGGIKFDLTACRGCGLCVAMCPALALDLENWERNNLSVLVGKLASEMKSPKMLVFRCQWASFPSLNGNTSPNVRFVDLPCASRVDINDILTAFQNGVDSVMIAACSEDDCKQEKASGKAKHQIAKFKERLAQIGLQDRLYFCNVAPRYPESLNKEIEQFTQQIAIPKEIKR